LKGVTANTGQISQIEFFKYFFQNIQSPSDLSGGFFYCHIFNRLAITTPGTGKKFPAVFCLSIGKKPPIALPDQTSCWFPGMF
jgi:hypothetical protein